MEEYTSQIHPNPYPLPNSYYRESYVKEPVETKMSSTGRLHFSNPSKPMNNTNSYL